MLGRDDRRPVGLRGHSERVSTRMSRDPSPSNGSVNEEPQDTLDEEPGAVKKEPEEREDEELEETEDGETEVKDESELTEDGETEVKDEPEVTDNAETDEMEGEELEVTVKQEPEETENEEVDETVDDVRDKTVDDPRAGTVDRELERMEDDWREETVEQEPERTEDGELETMDEEPDTVIEESEETVKEEPNDSTLNNESGLAGSGGEEVSKEDICSVDSISTQTGTEAGNSENVTPEQAMEDMRTKDYSAAAQLPSNVEAGSEEGTSNGEEHAGVTDSLPRSTSKYASARLGWYPRADGGEAHQDPELMKSPEMSAQMFTVRTYPITRSRKRKRNDTSGGITTSLRS